MANLAWAIALIGWPDRELLHATAKCVEAKGDFSSQEFANTAWAFAVFEIGHDPLCDALCADSSKCVALPLSFKISGAEWVNMADALYHSGVDCRIAETPRTEFLSTFEESIYWPLVRHLQQLMRAPKDEAAAAWARGALERACRKLEITSLGSVHTSGALSSLGMLGRWTHATRAALRCCTNHKVIGLPHQRDVLAWVRCQLSVQILDEEEEIQDRGRWSCLMVPFVVRSMHWYLIITAPVMRNVLPSFRCQSAFKPQSAEFVADSWSGRP